MGEAPQPADWNARWFRGSSFVEAFPPTLHVRGQKDADLG